jgi:hypothetical protein
MRGLGRIARRPLILSFALPVWGSPISKCPSGQEMARADVPFILCFPLAGSEGSFSRISS